MANAGVGSARRRWIDKEVGRMARTRTRNLGLCAAAAAVVGLLAATPAGATVVDRGTYTNSYSFEYDDCGFEVLVERHRERPLPHTGGQGQDRHRLLSQQQLLLHRDPHQRRHRRERSRPRATPSSTRSKRRRVEGNIFEFEAVDPSQTFRMYDSAGQPRTARQRLSSTSTPCSTPAAMTCRARRVHRRPRRRRARPTPRVRPTDVLPGASPR